MRVISNSTRALAVAERSTLPVRRQATSMHASTSTLSSLVQRPQRRQLASVSVGKLQTMRSSRSVLAVAAEPLYDIYVKGAPVEGLVNEKGELGDCEPEVSAVWLAQCTLLHSGPRHEVILTMQAHSRKGP